MSSRSHPTKKHFEDHGAGNQTRYELIQRSADEDWDVHQPKAGVYGSGKVHTHFGEMHGYEKNMTTVNFILIGFIVEVTARVLAESVPMIFGTRALLKRALVPNACRTHRVLSTLKSTR